MISIKNLILTYGGHFSFDGKRLEVVVGDRVASVVVSEGVDIESNYVGPIYRAFKDADICSPNGEILRPLNIDW